MLHILMFKYKIPKKTLICSYAATTLHDFTMCMLDTPAAINISLHVIADPQTLFHLKDQVNICNGVMSFEIKHNIMHVHGETKINDK